MIALLDVNVLLALFDDQHEFHDLAHDWFADNGRSGWASCPLTENGLLRILGNPARMAAHLPIPKLVALLQRFCSKSDHHFWTHDVSFRNPAVFNVAGIHGPKQLTDIYLLALAVNNGGCFATFDDRVSIATVKGARPDHLVVLAPSK